ncbi:MAG: hypothetical protein CM15mP98_09130 [Paracoccaceae bacterium]|nr:MAG: hypothetical protein CM15mP98_09130 [Paracoccaceae bacterium]
MGSIYWFFGFLRMGVTGLVAQARGANEYVEVSSILVRGSSYRCCRWNYIDSVSLVFIFRYFLFLVGAKALRNWQWSICHRVFGAPFAISMFVLLAGYLEWEKPFPLFAYWFALTF